VYKGNQPIFVVEIDLYTKVTDLIVSTKIPEHTSVVIVGAGPVGLSCSLALRVKNIPHVVLDRGSRLNHIRLWPQQSVFFSTADKISIGGYPFATAQPHPTREEALRYYNGLITQLHLPVIPYVQMDSIQPASDGYQVSTNKGNIHAKRVVIATGYLGQPRRVGVLGEDLPHVTHFPDDVLRYAGMQVVVVGGSHSAADISLACYRAGAAVTLIHRRATLSDRLKYWIKPDLENRIKEGSIRAFFLSAVDAIHDQTINIRNLNTNKVQTLPADFVLLMTGFMPDVALLQRCGIEVDRTTLLPSINPDTYETNMPGVYLAGSVMGGKKVGSLFIENGRYHADVIAAHIDSQLG
jgi:thioredoxin reductase (NADPH)